MSTPLLSVIVTCHSEGILLHRTLRSVYRSLSLLDNKACEVIIHADSPTQSTEKYLSYLTDLFPAPVVLKNSFGDLGMSRNFAIGYASGKYIATIDGDDIMSKNWLKTAIDALERQNDIAIAHSALTVEFEGANSVVFKHGGIDLATDTLLSVYSNRWNSVIVARRDTLPTIPYTKNGDGYGYEDWHLNNELIAAGAKHILVPETVIFVRRKTAGSLWLAQVQSMSVLKKNSLLSFETVRNIGNLFSDYLPKNAPGNAHSAREFIKKYPILHIPSRKVKSILVSHLSMKRQHSQPKLPEWLIDEWKDAHTVDRQLYPTKRIMRTLEAHDSLTIKHKVTGAIYKAAIDSLRHNSYDYLLFAPWISTGGADKFIINYVNTIAKIKPHKRVLVITTLPSPSTQRESLAKGVDFLDFGTITCGVDRDIKYRIMSHLIENGGITHIHIINSEFGYDYIHDHSTYIAANKKVIVTSFSQSIDADGRLYGYSHTHVPLVYDLATLITTDNSAVTKMWHDEYGFDSSKMRIHKTPVQLGETAFTPSKQKNKNGNLHVLWAARLAPEKLATIVPEIGKHLKNTPITIDMYGQPDQNYSTSFLKHLPSNIRYMGGFSGFSSLPHEEYDAFLYTSLFDGMPNVLLEAAEVGLPIVASSVGGIPEFLTPDNGILVEDISDAAAYADALRLLAESPEARQHFSENAYKSLLVNYNKDQYDNSIVDMLNAVDY